MTANDESVETAAPIGRVKDEKRNREPMKFKNGDISLKDAIKRNGGRLAGLNMTALFDTSW